MKTGFNKYWTALMLFMGLAFIASPANAIGTLIVAAVMNTTVFTFGMTIAAMAINIAVSMIVAKNAASGLDGSLSGTSQNPGNRQSVPPATNNKLPVIYGSAWTGGTVVDMSISVDNQWIYYVIALCEVTNNGTDQITFGPIYFGGRRCYFFTDKPYKVESLQDTSTLVSDYTVADNLYIYLYNNGTTSNVNSSYSAYQIMTGSGPFNVDLTYKWTTQKMTNCAFAIVQMKYSQDANITGFQQMRFNVINPRNLPGNCFLDYFTNTVYGAGINIDQIDTDSLDSLNAYCNEDITYTTYSGGAASQKRFQFNGVIDTSRPIMDNLQDMATSCDCLIKYNELSGLWGVIVQKPEYTAVMDINDSNIIGAITVSPLDIANSYNVIECKFPDNTSLDSFNSATFDLAELAPALLYPNEPINKQSVTLSLVNNDITAQYIANRLLEGCREDLNITCKIDYTGLQLEAGDLVTVTNSNYGWDEKFFRITKVTEQFGSDGTITADLMLSEYNAQVYDDKNITEFTPSPNTGLPDGLSFGILAAPIITEITTTAVNPYFLVNITAPPTGITQYAEIYYCSIYVEPVEGNLIFAGTTEIRPNGDSYTAGEALPPVTITNIPSGDWTFYYKIVNGLGKSGLSEPSGILYWRPMTFQYSQTDEGSTANYLMLAYATNSTGTTGFSFNPRNKTYFGIRSTNAITQSTDPSNYKWYPASPAFSTTIYLLYAGWGNKTFSFATGTAGYYGGAVNQGNFVSTNINYTGAIWSALVDPVGSAQSYIDLTKPTGQQVLTGTTTNYGSLAVQPSVDGKLQVSLNQFLDFGQSGGSTILQKTVQPAYLTIDIYGRVVGVEYPDNFYMTVKNFTATSGQTVFANTRAADYRVDNCLVFQNGILVDDSEYTDTSGSTGTVTFATGRTLNDRITIISFRSYHLDTAGSFDIGKTYTIVSVGSTNFTLIGAASNTVGTVFVATGVGTGSGTASTIYNSFSRFTQNITNQSSITPTNPIVSGFEYLFFNGVAMLDPDYDIDANGRIINMPANMTGAVTCIQWSQNNLTVPNGNPYVVLTHTIESQTSYTFGLTQYAFNLYENGVLLVNGTTTPTAFTPNDYTTVSGGYILGVSPTVNTDRLLQQSFTRTGAA